MQAEAKPSFYSGHPLDNPHKRIGLIFGSMASSYMAAIVFGASDYAQQHGYNLIAFSGGPFNNPAQDANKRDKLFDVHDPSLFDGLIITMGSLSRYIDEQQSQQFLAQYAHIPIVNIGNQFEGLTNLQIDNSDGFRKMVRHLIRDHGYQRIAFSSGPANHASSNEKLRAYMDVLAEYDIPFNPDFVFYGHLTGRSGDNCVQTLIDERKLALDAIVTVTDEEAFNTIAALKQRGIRIPEDIAVTGCKGTAESFFHEPSLTTIKEPIYELGRAAAEALIARLEQRAAPENLVIPNQPIFRQSCGCTEEMSLPATAQTSLSSNIQAIAEAAQENIGIVFDTSEMQQIARLFEEADQADLLEIAAKQLETILKNNIRSDQIIAWLPMIPAIMQFLADTSVEATCKSQCMQQLESIHNQISQKVFVFRNSQSEKYVSAFRELSISLNIAFKAETMENLLVRDIGINECYICIFEDKNDVTGLVRNVLSIRNKKRLEIPPQDALFPAAQLIPRTIAPYHAPYSLVILPMLFRSEAIGYIIMNIHERKGVIYENLQSLLSGALKNEIQIQELKEAERKFSDIAHSTSDWLWEIDNEYRYTYCSSGVENVLGYSAQEILGHSLFDYVLPSETNYIYMVKQYLIPQQKPLSNLESLHTHKSGHQVTLLVSGKPIIKNGLCVGYRGAFKDTTAIKEQENRIRQLAYHDLLTDLPNRTLFNDRLKMTLSRAQREQQKFAIIFLDLDRFKYVNDTLGHEAGDALLKMVATRLKSCMRESDTLARLGGDEFTMILDNIDHIKSITTIAQRVVYALSAPIDLNGHTLFVTSSIGIATYPADGADTATLLKNADKAMYKAKEQGKNRYVFYDAQMGDKSHRRMEMENLLHQAIQYQLFTLHYQPQVCATSGAMIGAEALIRLHTPAHGFISPFEFIGLAEEVGLIEIIGLWVFETACKQARQWQLAGYEQRISVNVSARQLKNSLLSDVFINIAEHFGVAPHLLEIEITENAVIDNEETAKEILDKLHAFGFKIAIDDFGTGYSSLSSLRKFPIDTIKIDRSFINDATSNIDSAHIVSAIVHIAQSMQLSVIAEGVETIAQLEMLREIGCDEIQGYLFSKPVPAEQLDQLFKAGQFTLTPDENI